MNITFNFYRKHISNKSNANVAKYARWLNLRGLAFLSNRTDERMHGWTDILITKGPHKKRVPYSLKRAPAFCGALITDGQTDRQTIQLLYVYLF